MTFVFQTTLAWTKFDVVKLPEGGERPVVSHQHLDLNALAGWMTVSLCILKHLASLGLVASVLEPDLHLRLAES